MIRIGLGERQKQKEVAEYVQAHGIKKIFCFYFKKFPLKLKADCEIEHIEYADIEMYKYFYRLLEEIDENNLIIINECMRTQNRSELIYNCAHHYLNQTPHRMIFEHFPIIERRDDFMILLDMENKGKYKGRGFDYNFLKDEDIKIRPHWLKLDIINVSVDEKDKARYEAKKEQLFASLGNKDPDNIPRALQLFAGDLKKSAIGPDKIYVARNKRFNRANVLSYQDITGPGEYIVIDTHYRRLDFNDFLKTTGMTKLQYLCTPLSIDNVITNEFIQWKARMDAIYAKANLY
jgi:hypothetical protein